MKKLLLILFLIPVLFLSCSKEEDDSLIGTWESIDAHNQVVLVVKSYSDVVMSGFEDNPIRGYYDSKNELFNFSLVTSAEFSSNGTINFFIADKTKSSMSIETRLIPTSSVPEEEIQPNVKITLQKIEE